MENGQVCSFLAYFCLPPAVMMMTITLKMLKAEVLSGTEIDALVPSITVSPKASIAPNENRSRF